MNKITNYWLILFLFGNICMQFQILQPIAYLFFYPLLVIGIFSILLNFSLFMRSISKYKFIFTYILILWIYQLVFGLSRTHSGTWVYLIAKTTMLMMTVIAIERNPNYYHFGFCKQLLFLCSMLIAIGLVFFDSISAGGRHLFGFGNVNAGGHLASICFAGLLITNPLTGKKWLSRILMLICLLAVLYSGSRSSAGIASVALFIKYGLKKELLIAIAVCYVIAMKILPSFNINLIGLERFTNSIENRDFSSNRELEREAAIYMINESPIAGNGIVCPNSDAANEISKLGSHNTYLDWLKWFGIPLASILIISLVIDSLRLYIKFHSTKNDYDKFHLFVVISTILVCFFEGYIWGVNEMSNTIFFTSLAILCYKEKTKDKRLWQIK